MEFDAATEIENLYNYDYSRLSDALNYMNRCEKSIVARLVSVTFTHPIFATSEFSEELNLENCKKYTRFHANIKFSADLAAAVNKIKFITEHSDPLISKLRKQSLLFMFGKKNIFDGEYTGKQPEVVNIIKYIIEKGVNNVKKPDILYIETLFGQLYERTVSGTIYYSAVLKKFNFIYRFINLNETLFNNYTYFCPYFIEFYREFLEEVKLSEFSDDIHYFELKYFALLDRTTIDSQDAAILRIQKKYFEINKNINSCLDVITMLARTGKKDELIEFINLNYDFIVRCRSKVPRFAYATIHSNFTFAGHTKLLEVFYNEVQEGNSIRLGINYTFYRGSAECCDSCSICFEKVGAEICIKCLKCSNILGHNTCVQAWMQRSNNCTFCREQLS
jgi:hypothetical protein